MTPLTVSRIQDLLAAAGKARVLVLGDIMLDQFIWGRVGRISPEAPVPVVEMSHESWMPGGAANVARNLTAFRVPTELVSIVGDDESATTLGQLLRDFAIDDGALLRCPTWRTNVKTRIIAHRQQVVRVDREPRGGLEASWIEEMLGAIAQRLDGLDAILIGDYGKGVVTQHALDQIKALAASRGIWISVDPKPVHRLDLSGVSLITPNRRECFQLADLQDRQHAENPLEDECLLEAAELLMERLRPSILLVTLAEQGMLLLQPGRRPFHIPTIEQEVSDVSGAGDTVIASFTMASVAGAAPEEAAELSNHAAGVVVRKLGTASVTPEELLESFKPQS